MTEVMQQNGPPLLPTTDPPPVPSGRSTIGGRCSGPSDCAVGLLCFGAAQDRSLPETVPGGYCAPPCSDDSDCAGVAPGSACWSGQYCTAPCAAAQDSEADGVRKCGGRDDLACSGRLSSGGSCEPACINDLVCGEGRECSYASGTCLLSGSSDVLSRDGRIGSACSPDASTCRGYCIDGGEGSASLCSGVCSVGVPGCGGGLSNVCVPRSVDGRRRDLGNCHQACRSSADCSVGQGECVPSGLLSATNEALSYCAPLRPSAPTSVPQRLSLDDMQSATGLGADVVYVQGFVTGAARSRLFVEQGAVCVEGEVAERDDADAGAAGDERSAAHLSFQFGRIDPPSSRDVSRTPNLHLTLAADRGVFIYATFLSRPGFEYGADIVEPTPEAQPYTFTPDDLRARQPRALPWDSRLLDAVTLRLADGDGPFRACVSALAFE